MVRLVIAFSILLGVTEMKCVWDDEEFVARKTFPVPHIPIA